MLSRRNWLAGVGMSPLMVMVDAKQSESGSVLQSRSLDEFSIGDVLYWDWDENRIVVKGPGSEWTQVLCDQLGISFPVQSNDGVEYSYYEKHSFVELQLLKTIYRAPAFIQDVKTGEQLKRVVSYNAITRLCVRIATCDGTPQIDPGTGYVGRHYEYRDLIVKSTR